jgi:hypothetical protein
MSSKKGLMNRVASFVWVSVLLTGGAHAQVSTHITYEDHIKKSRNFVALDENLFGDKVSLQDGALSFRYDDVVLPTTSGLRLSIGRRSAANYRARNTPGFHVFGSEWDLDVPYMMGTYDSRDGWNAGNDVFLAGPPPITTVAQQAMSDLANGWFRGPTTIHSRSMRTCTGRVCRSTFPVRATSNC